LMLSSPVSTFLYICFFILLRPPPISPLFPYTTLFRSVLAHRRTLSNSLLASFSHKFRIIAKHVSTFADRADFAACGLAFAHEVRDRKSTRLNSSHLGISYAVFCLKKKNKNEIRRDDND